MNPTIYEFTITILAWVLAEKNSEFNWLDYIDIHGEAHHCRVSTQMMKMSTKRWIEYRFCEVFNKGKNTVDIQRPKTNQVSTPTSQRGLLARQIRLKTRSFSSPTFLSHAKRKRFWGKRNPASEIHTHKESFFLLRFLFLGGWRSVVRQHNFLSSLL